MSKVNESQVPEIRFKGFDREWEFDILNNLASFSKGKGYAKKDLKEHGTPIVLYGSLYTNYKTIINEVHTYAEQIDKSVISQGNEVVVPASGESAEDISRASAIISPGIILGGDLNILRPKKEIEQTFLALTLTYGPRKYELVKKAEGVSIIHLYNNNIKEVKMFYPILTEQQKIGDLFAKIDQLVEKQQSYVLKLMQFKINMQRNLFVNDLSVSPKFRLGKENRWSKVLVEDLLKEFHSGGTPKASEPKYYNGHIPFLSISDITSNSNSVINKTEKYITQLGLDNSSAKIMPRETISLAMYASYGKVAIMGTEMATSQAFFNMVLDERTDIEYFYQYLLFRQNFKLWEKYLSTGTQPNLNATKIRNLLISIPTLETQQKIGKFFKTIDDLIEKQNKKLEAYQQMKKALLQKMFV